MSAPRIEDLSDTAFLTAHARAVETERADALFKDPLASKLLTERGRELGQGLQASYMMGWSISIRTVIIDDLIAQAVGKGVDAVVNLGAGLDTRPYRLSLPPTLQWIEIDQPHVIAFKAGRLQGEEPCCQLRRKGLDVTDVNERRKALADIASRSRSMLVVAEGLIPYLAEDVVAGLADDIRAVPSVRGWIVDHIPAQVIAFRNRAGAAGEPDPAPLLFVPTDWFAFFARHGWRAGLIRNLFDAGLQLRSPMPLPPGTPNFAATSDREARDLSFPGYVLLEPQVATPTILAK
jgi:methyltransferase (TIGR00027 family)